MSRMECSFFLIGVLLISLGLVLSSSAPEEPTNTTETQCEKAMREAQSSFSKCTDDYSESEDYQEAMRSNLSTCPTCLLWCRKSNTANCVKKVMSDNYQCLEVSKNISQSFFVGLMDSLLEMSCQNEAEAIKDVTSFKADTVEGLRCAERVEKCEVGPLLSFLSVNGTLMDTPRVEYTERGFCRMILEYVSCVSKEMQECFERLAKGFNRYYKHIKTSTSCAEYLQEGQIEDAYGNTPPAN